MKTPGFDLDVLATMVMTGHVDAHRATVWLRSEAPGQHEVAVRAADGQDNHTFYFRHDADQSSDYTTSVLLGDERPLHSGTQYRYEVRGPDGRVLGEGQFETSPSEPDAAPQKFAIALASCNQPFRDDGTVEPHALGMLKALPGALQAHDVKRVIMIGDQMYADLPEPLSLFNEDYLNSIFPERSSIFECSYEEVRRAYQQRYRTYYSVPEFRATLSKYPCLMIFDDHEICDNFGSSPEHASERWRHVRRGALDAAFDYQGKLHLIGNAEQRQPGRGNSLHHEWDFGPVAGFTMDLRSERHADDERLQLFGEAQLKALEASLKRHSHLPFFLLGLSVPLVHVPDWLSTVGTVLDGEDGDAADRFSNPKAEAQQKQLVDLLARHVRENRRQCVVVLAGDVHTGVVGQLQLEEGGRCITQLISSPISNHSSALAKVVAALLPKVADGFSMTSQEIAYRLMPPGGALKKNPCAELNAGLLCFERDAEGWSCTIKLVSYTDSAEPRHEVVYESQPLRP